MSGSLFLMLLWGSFPSVYLLCPNSGVFWFCLTVLYFVSVPQEPICLLVRDRKGGSRWRDPIPGGEELGGIDRGETTVWICM